MTETEETSPLAAAHQAVPTRLTQVKMLSGMSEVMSGLPLMARASTDIGSGLAACVIGAAIYDAGRLFLS